MSTKPTLIICDHSSANGSRGSAYAFAEDEWSSLEEALAPVDKVLKSLAWKYGMGWHAYASKGWPGRTLKKRRLLKTYILRISLNSDYVRSGLITWDIIDLWKYDYGELINKTVSYELLAGASDLELPITETIIVSAVGGGIVVKTGTSNEVSELPAGTADLMPMSAPHFYLASSEGYGLEEPRQCWRAGRLKTGIRDDLLLVKIDPPLLGQDYGRKQDVEYVILATRHEGRTLFPISEWPAYVHVAIPLVANPEQRDELQPSEYHLIAWAELYQTEEDARRK